MIYLKGFIRQKSTKLFLFSFTSLLVGIFLLISFIHYYSNLKSNIYKENSYILLISKDNLYDVLKKKDVNNLQEVVLFNIDETNNSLNDLNFRLDNLIDQNMNNFFIVVPDKKNDLDKYQIKFALPQEIVENIKNIKDLNNKNILFLHNQNILNLMCTGIINSNFSRIFINEDTFNELLLQQNNYSYIFSLNNYDNLDIKLKEINDIDNVNSVEFIQSFKNITSINTLEQLKSIVPLLKNICLFGIIIFVILYTLIIENNISDELDKMILERKIGFSRFQIFKIIIIKITFINIFVILFANIVYVSLIKIINLFRLNIFFINTVPIFVLISLLQLFLCILLSYNMLKHERR